MTQHLPPHLLALFAPRPPIPYIPPAETKPPPAISGVAEFLNLFEPEPENKPEVFPIETRKQRKKRVNQLKLKRHAQELEELIQKWEPAKDTKATSDPYKTLFIARLNYETTEHKLKREFESFGPVRKVRVVQDQNGKPRGYGFVEFDRERDMKSAYKQADGRKIDGKRIVVDIERGRTVRNWRPRRLGGGLGYTRRGPEDTNQKNSGRELDRERSPEHRPPSPRERERERERDRDRDRGRHYSDRHRERERSREKGDVRDKSDRERDREQGEIREREREREGRRY